MTAIRVAIQSNLASAERVAATIAQADAIRAEQGCVQFEIANARILGSLQEQMRGGRRRVIEAGAQKSERMWFIQVAFQIRPRGRAVDTPCVD